MKKRTSSVKPLLFITFVLIVLAGVIGFRISKLSVEQQVLEAELETIRQDIEDEKERYIQLLKDREYSQSNAYIEKLAREKFGLVKPNEIIYIPEEE